MRRLWIVVVLVLIAVLFATSMVLSGPTFAQATISPSVRGSPTFTVAVTALDVRIDIAKGDAQITRTYPSDVDITAATTAQHGHDRGTFKGDGNVQIDLKSGTCELTDKGNWTIASMNSERDANYDLRALLCGRPAT